LIANRARHFALMNLKARHEERNLRLHGDSYFTYVARTGGFSRVQLALAPPVAPLRCPAPPRAHAECAVA